jgi:hypothetical protein
LKAQLEEDGFDARDTSKIGPGDDVDVPVGKGLQTSASWGHQSKMERRDPAVGQANHGDSRRASDLDPAAGTLPSTRPRSLQAR